jgi:hypothetical protein
METTKKITRATIKTFIKKALASNNLYLMTKSKFDGMSDMVEDFNDPQFRKASGVFNPNDEHRLGISPENNGWGLWLIKGDDYYKQFENDEFIGFEWWNCCGSGLIATKK